MPEITIEVEERDYPDLFKLLEHEHDLINVTIHGLAFRIAPVRLVTEQSNGRKQIAMTGVITMRFEAPHA